MQEDIIIRKNIMISYFLSRETSYKGIDRATSCG